MNLQGQSIGTAMTLMDNAKDAVCEEAHQLFKEHHAIQQPFQAIEACCGNSHHSPEMSDVNYISFLLTCYFNGGKKS